MKPFTVMLWKAKGELRVVRTSPGLPPDSPWYDYDRRLFAEFEFLPEHAGGAPQFDTADEGWSFIRRNYPHLAP